MIPARLLLSLVIASIFALSARAELPPPAPPEALWAVKVSAERVNGGARLSDSAREQVEQLGFAPYWEHEVDEGEEGVWRYGLVGKLDSMTDAIILRNQLREAGLVEALEKSFPSLMSDEFQIEVQSPELPIFSPQRHAYESRATPMTPAKVDAFADLESLDDSQLEELAEAFTTLDLPVKEKKRLANLLAREMTRRVAAAHNMLHDPAMGDARVTIEEMILPLVLPAASDETLDEFTLEARWIAATLWHEYLQDRLSAYRAIRQILDDYGEERDAVRARGLVTLSALLMEMAQRGTADREEAKRLACMVHEVVPRDYESARATAELVYWQSYFHEGDYETIIAGHNGFSSRYPTALRETSGALLAVAMAQSALGNTEEALEALRALLVLPLAESDIYHWAGRRNNVQMRAVGMLRHLASQEGMRMESEIEELYQAILIRPPGDENFSPTFPLEILERSTRQRRAISSAIHDASPRAPMDETEKWLRIDAEGHGLDYEEHRLQLSARLKESGSSEAEYATYIKQQLTQDIRQLMREQEDRMNEEMRMNFPGLPADIGLTPLEQPETHSVLGYSTHSGHSVYLAHREVWHRKAEGTLEILHQLEPTSGMQAATVGKVGERMIAVIRSQNIPSQMMDPDLEAQMEARRQRSMDLRTNANPLPEELTILEIGGDAKRSLRVEMAESWTGEMWLRGEGRELLLLRRFPSGESVIERMPLSPNPFDESARFERIAKFTGPFTGIDYDDFTDTFVGSRPTDDGRSMITSWSLDNPAFPLETRYVDGVCMSHKARDGRVVGLTVHFNTETRQQFKRLTSIHLDSDDPPSILYDFEDAGWSPDRIVALTREDAILVGRLRPHLIGPAALEQPNTPEIGLISAPLR